MVALCFSGCAMLVVASYSASFVSIMSVQKTSVDSQETLLASRYQLIWDEGSANEVFAQVSKFHC